MKSFTQILQALTWWPAGPPVEGHHLVLIAMALVACCFLVHVVRHHLATYRLHAWQAGYSAGWSDRAELVPGPGARPSIELEAHIAVHMAKRRLRKAGAIS